MVKRIYLFILLLIGLNLPISAQIHLPFPDSTASWKMVYSCIQDPYFPPSVGLMYYSTNGDTVLSGISYRILYNENSGVGFFRIDSSRVFFKNLSFDISQCGFADTNEVLLYDFNLGIGDSIKNFDDGAVSYYLKVVSIDSVIINSNNLRRWSFIASNPYFFEEKWIEGIGSDIGFFTYYFPFECSQTLACFNEGGLDYPVNLGGATSCETVGMSDVKHISDFEIFPNPGSGNVILKLKKQISEWAFIKIYDNMGQLVMQHAISDNATSIDLSGHKEGMYIIEVFVNDNITYERFLLCR